MAPPRDGHTFRPGDRVRYYDSHAAKVVAVFGSLLKVEFETGARVGKLPLVEHHTQFVVEPNL
jgi:hypothetical protein